MGIPTFFRELVTKYKGTNFYAGLRPGAVLCDYLFLDYNAMVYDAYQAIKGDVEGKGLPKADIERRVIDKLLQETAHIVNDIVQPKKLLYFALDGTAPRMKLNQSRSRRYKSVVLKEYELAQRRRFQMIEDVPWDASSNISPGTEFMEELARRLLEAVKGRVFVGDRQSKLQTIISHSNVSGEGEHKFLPIIRNLRKHPVEMNAPVFVISKDADVIVLSMLTHKSNMTVMRPVAGEKDKDFQEEFGSFEYIGLNIDQYRGEFHRTLSRNTPEGTTVRELDIVNDYNFMTFFSGNDFVVSLPFFKIRRGGLERVITIYKELRPSQEVNLITYNPDAEPQPMVNMTYFRAIMGALASREGELLKLQQKELYLMLSGKRGMPRPEKEASLTPFQIAMSRFEHTEICVPIHPLHQEYKADFKKIDYRQEPAVYKAQYYKHFVGLDAEGPGGPEEYQRVIDHMCHNYLESLVYTLRYYLVCCPSWRWSYNYRVSPFIQDVVAYLDRTDLDINTITFATDRPYSPFEQLLIVLPPQMEHILPEPLRPIMKDVDHGCVHYFPTRVRIDAADGLKYIYSEAITPDIDESVLLGKFAEMETGLSERDRSRNTVTEKAIYVKNT